MRHLLWENSVENGKNGSMNDNEIFKKMTKNVRMKAMKEYFLDNIC